MIEITENNIALFASIFRGRQDIYAVRWEKDGKSGYTPAYKVDWSGYVNPFAFDNFVKDKLFKEFSFERFKRRGKLNSKDLYILAFRKYKQYGMKIIKMETD